MIERKNSDRMTSALNFLTPKRCHNVIIRATFREQKRRRNYQSGLLRVPCIVRQSNQGPF